MSAVQSSCEVRYGCMSMRYEGVSSTKRANVSYVIPVHSSDLYSGRERRERRTSARSASNSEKT